MSVTVINQLKEQRAGLIDRMRELVNTAESEERDLTAEEVQEYDRVEKDAEALETRSGRLEKLAGISPIPKRETDATIVEDEEDPEKRKAPATLAEYREQRGGIRPQDKQEYREAFYKWISTADERDMESAEFRVLSKASAGAGLNLVPTDFARDLVQALRDVGVMRQISNVITTDSGDALQVPSVSSHGTAAWTAENAAFTVSDEAFGQFTLNAYKAATIMLVSEELLTDSAFDLQAYIRDEFGQRIGILENTAYVVGDGSGKPTGVTTTASAGATAASATVIVADDLVNLFHSLLPPYRRNASWILNDAVIKAVRKIKTGISGDTTYIWQPGLQAGAPDTLLGKPVYADPDMNGTMTTGLIVALFGDFSYYRIRDVNGIAFQRLNELYAANGQVGFRAFHRTDGKLLNVAAIKKLVLA